MTSRERQVLELIRRNPMVSQAEIAAELGISRSAVAGHIMKLTSRGVIRGRAYVIDESPYAVAIGGANIDICGAAERSLRMRDSNPGQVGVSPGGVARNVAENLARLGARCSLVAAVGGDHHGDLLVNQGRAAGIDMRPVLRLEGAATSTYLSILDDGGDMLCAVNDMGIVDEIRPEQLERHAPLLGGASVVIADTNLREETLSAAASAAGGAFFVDTVSAAKAERILDCLDRVHTLKASRIEVGALCGIESPTRRQLPRIARELHAQGVRRLFVTLGTDGVFYSDGARHGFEAAAAPADGVINANGAGDAFVAGLSFAWLGGWSLERTLAFSLAAAGVALSHAATINPAMSLDLVNERCEQAHAA